ETLDLQSSTQENILREAIQFVLNNKAVKKEYLDDEIDLSFTTEQWRKQIINKSEKGKILLNRRYLELCVFSHVANELRTKDIYIVGAESYADYRDELLPIEQCKEMLEEYCSQTDLPSSGAECVQYLKDKLTAKAKAVDDSYPDTAELTIDESGKPTLHKRNPKKRPGSAIWLEKMLKTRMKKRNLIDVLCSSHFYCG
ncbi:MAG TPA: Tn3 family transposase, partial [Flavobacteriaceae bacterium]|nr:Tn3 family transposase [Flavobacteriaceae bacterium]